VGIQGLFGGRQGDGKGLGALDVVPRAVLPTDGMMMGDRAARGHYRVRHARPDLGEHRSWVRAGAVAASEGVIGRGPVRVHWRDPTVDRAAPAPLLEDLEGRLPYGGVEVGPAIPGDRRLERPTDQAEPGRQAAAARNEGAAPGTRGALPAGGRAGI